MRKSFYLTLALTALSVFAMLALTGAVSRGESMRAAVTESEGAAENAGVSLSMHAACGRKLEWTAEYIPGQELRSDFRFVEEGVRNEYSYSASDIWISVPLNFGMSVSGGGVSFDDEYMWPSATVKAIAQDVSSRAEAGREHTETVLLSDYSDTIPLEINANLSAMYKDKNGEWTCVSDGIDDELARAIREYFRIPTPENFTVEMTVFMEEDGDICDITCNAYVNLYMDCTALEGEDGCWLYISGGYDGGELDTSLLPDGVGVFFFPYECEGDILRAHPEKLGMFFPLESDVSVYDMVFSKTGDILLFTTEADGNYIRVVDSKTGEQRQRICIGTDENTWLRRFVEEDYIAILYKDESFAVFEIGDDGLVSPGLDGTLPEIFTGERIYSMEYITTAYNGERFAIAAFLTRELENEHRSPATCDVALAVADEGGIVYYEKNRSSLDYIIDMPYKLQPLPFGRAPLKLTLI